jgi:hypothetical protein
MSQSTTKIDPGRLILMSCNSVLRLSYILRARLRVCRIDPIEQFAIRASGHPRSAFLEPHGEDREPEVAERRGRALQRMRFPANSARN